MSSKRDWNDISDDQSQSSNNVSLGQMQCVKKDQVIDLPCLTKMISTPLPIKKSLTNEQQNLLKLQNCPNETIWLFIPLFNKQKVNDVNNLLNKMDTIIRIQQFIKGWNVLTKRDVALKLITQGKKDQQLLLRFYFSNKNDKFQDIPKRLNNYKSYKTSEYIDKKIKYVAKSPNNNNSLEDLNKLDKQVKHQTQNDYQVRVPKSPSSKYQDKYRKYDKYTPNQQRYNNDSKKINGQSYKQKKQQTKRKEITQTKKNQDGKKRQNSKQSKNSSLNKRPKYILKNPLKDQPKYTNNQPKISNEQPKLQSPTNPQDQYYIQSPKKKPQSKPQVQKAINPIEKQQKQSDISESNSPIKKKKAKPKAKKIQLRDDNNPYSMLGSY